MGGGNPPGGGVGPPRDEVQMNQILTLLASFDEILTLLRYSRQFVPNPYLTQPLYLVLRIAKPWLNFTVELSQGKVRDLGSELKFKHLFVMPRTKDKGCVR